MTEEENKNWIQKFATMHIPSGNYLPLANNVTYLFTINDFGKEPEKIKKTFEGKDAGFKYSWNIHLLNGGFTDSVDAAYLKKHNEKKFKAIKELISDKNYELELSMTATKQLSTFILDNNLSEESIISFFRTGEKASTVYNFSLV